jgi:hypothetical protein
VSYSWSFLEVAAGTNTPVPTPNGLIEPGEAARFSLTVTVSPPIGSPASYTPPPPPGTGTIAGLGSVYLDLLGPATATGAWSFASRAPGWALGGVGGPSALGNSFMDIQAGQFIVPPASANPQNPVSGIWHAVWTPDSYAPRNVLFHSAIAGRGNQGSSILIQYGTDPMTGTPLYVGKFVASQHSQISIPIVPAPSAAPAMLLLAASRVHRHRPRSGITNNGAHS